MADKQYRQSILIGLLIGIGFASAFGLGFIVNNWVSTPTTNGTVFASSSTDYPLLAEVQNLVSRVYLRELPSSTEREYGAIHGMLETIGDPTTFFIEPPVARSESQALAGTYGGIGVQIKRLESNQFAMYPYDDSPAYEAGFRDDDILIAIGDLTIDATLAIDAVDQMLRGEVIDDNGVLIRAERNGDEIIEAFVTFDVINIPSVIARIVNEDDRLGYIQILRFTSRTPDELLAEFGVLEEQGILGLIVDLRDNGGGLLVESIEVADEFLSEGTIVIEQSRNTREIFSADADGTILEIPIVVLVNGRTASASELVAGALRDNGRGILIGQTTFGKGTVQQIFPLSDGSSVHITSAEWLTPNEETIASNGLIPDIEMIPDINRRDVEFGEAVRHLRSILDKQSK